MKYCTKTTTVHILKTEKEQIYTIFYQVITWKTQVFNDVTPCSLQMFIEDSKKGNASMFRVDQAWSLKMKTLPPVETSVEKV
jgi:hypothetical protein